jgi:hypothetical protein
VAEELLPEPTDAECFEFLENLARSKEGLVLHNGNYSGRRESLDRPGLNVKLCGGLRVWCARQIQFRRFDGKSMTEATDATPAP